jgi:hypothetical protein
MHDDNDQTLEALEIALRRRWGVLLQGRPVQRENETRAGNETGRENIRRVRTSMRPDKRSKP